MKVLTRIVDNKEILVEVNEISGELIRMYKKDQDFNFDISHVSRFDTKSDCVIFYDESAQSLVKEIGFSNVCALVVV